MSPEKGIFPLKNIHSEVKTFLDAAETLLSRALLTPLNEDERELIRGYVESLGKKARGSRDG